MTWKFRIVLLGVVFGMTPVAVAGDSPEDRQIQSLVEHFLKNWETGNAQRFEAMLHDDVEFAYPGDRLNKAEVVAMFRDYQQKKTDIRVYFWDQFFVQGDRFAFAYQFAATDRETNKRQAVGTGVMGRVADGKIILFKEYYDEEVALLQYAGKLPLDEGIVSPWPASIWLRPESVD